MRRRAGLLALALLLGVLAALLVGCAGSPSPLRPESPGANEVRNVTWILVGISLIIFLGVETTLLLAIFRFRNRPPDEARQTYGSRRIEVVWTAIPVVIVAGIFYLTVTTMDTPQLPGDALPLEATGRNWWWDFRYPQQDFASPNEIHVPVNRAVDVELTSGDVIHSFWLPQMGGKTDMVPGKTNRQSFTVTSPGVYQGICGEFCGLQHAHMRFLLVAESAEEFSAWVERQQQPAAEPASAEAQQGQELFLRLPCAGCHTIRGTDAAGTAGPDLTHLAGRRTLAAGTLNMDPGELARWIRDPQGIKPGNMMPSTPLDEEEVAQLVEYLKGLE